MRIQHRITVPALLLASILGMADVMAHPAAIWKAEWPRTDFTRHTVHLDEIFSGGPPKDGIPSVDKPRFVSPIDAARWLDPREPVIVFQHRGDARAYPLQILIFHEIVNDVVGSLPVAVTFCPLCNASIVFDRKLSGTVLDFGTTGKLRKSDLVMYDRKTESWWQQFTGEGIVGHHSGAKLVQLPSAIVSFGDFRVAYPLGRVLSRETGYVRQYGRNPYRGYDRIDDQPFLLKDPVDPRLPAMERVLGISKDGATRIYPISVLDTHAVINDQIGKEPVVVLSREGLLSPLDAESIRDSREIRAAVAYSRLVKGRIAVFEKRAGNIIDRETGSRWNIFGHAISGPLQGSRLAPVDSGVHFAFAWLAFYPESEIFRKQPSAVRSKP